MKALAILLALAGVARADDDATTVSMPLTTLALHGVSVEVERALPAPRLSLAGAVGLRSTAAGDYDSRTVELGAELRRAVWRDLYVSGRVDVARTSVTDAAAMDLGAVTTFAVSALTGYRFTPWRDLEVRPYVGVAVRTERGAGPGWTRPGLAYGLAIGWRF